MRKIFTDYEMMKAFISKLKIDSDVGKRRIIDARHYYALEQIHKSCEHYLAELKEEEALIENYTERQPSPPAQKKY